MEREREREKESVDRYKRGTENRRSRIGSVCSQHRREWFRAVTRFNPGSAYIYFEDRFTTS